MPIGPGTLVGTYRVESALGSGGMGEVYLATDTRLNRQVALKFLSRATADQEGRRRFQQEVRAVSSLNHPHILTIHEAGEHEGRDYLVAEFVDGGTLKTWTRAGKRTWRQTVELLVGVADALAVAHEAGILHRDVKSDNILVTKNGYAKLADFGLAKLTAAPDEAATAAVTEPRTRRGVVMGTIAYMSPEQLSGARIDARSDIFSFGVVLYEALAGTRPFAGTTELHVIESILHEPPKPLSEDVPAALRALVDKALEKDPADRYQSMRDLVVDLRRLIRHTAEVTAVRPSGSSRTWRIAAALVAVGVVLAGAAWWRGRGTLPAATAQPAIQSIAVLPLQNLSGDANEEYFSDGMTEELISSLAQVHALRVISRTSVMRYKGATRPLPDIARELGVDAIIEGSVRRASGRVRVTAQLIRASSDAHLWAQDFDRDFTDVLKLQGDIAQAIVREVKAQVTPAEAGRLAVARPVNAAAHDAYLLGRYYFSQQHREGTARAIKFLEDAIRLQPDYAAAHAALSVAWQQNRDLGFSPEEGAMRTAAQRAIELDPNLADAHAALAGLKFDDWDWAGADAAYRRALDLNPDSVECACYANVLAAFGRLREAIELIDHLQRANPLSPELQFNFGFVLYMARRYADAEPHFLRAKELVPGTPFYRLFLSSAYFYQGRLQDAVTEVAPPFRPSFQLAAAYTRLGRRAEALKVVEALPETNPYGVAMAHLALGDKERGLQWLTRAVDQRQGFVRWMKVQPEYDDVRSDPRFQALLARLKLPD